MKTKMQTAVSLVISLLLLFSSTSQAGFPWQAYECSLVLTNRSAKYTGPGAQEFPLYWLRHVKYQLGKHSGELNDVSMLETFDSTNKMGNEAQKARDRIQGLEIDAIENPKVLTNGFILKGNDEISNYLQTLTSLKEGARSVTGTKTKERLKIISKTGQYITYISLLILSVIHYLHPDISTTYISTEQIQEALGWLVPYAGGTYVLGDILSKLNWRPNNPKGVSLFRFAEKVVKELQTEKSANQPSDRIIYYSEDHQLPSGFLVALTQFIQHRNIELAAGREPEDDTLSKILKVDDFEYYYKKAIEKGEEHGLTFKMRSSLDFMFFTDPDTHEPTLVGFLRHDFDPGPRGRGRKPKKDEINAITEIEKALTGVLGPAIAPAPVR